MNEHGDIIVVGGGPVGSALALGLDKAGFTVTLLEARAGGDAQAVTVTVDQAGTTSRLRARLAAVADGGASLKLSQLKLHDYGQCALVCDVAADEPHRNRAFERFTEEGPLALLPNAVMRSAVRWAPSCCAAAGRYSLCG